MKKYLLALSIVVFAASCGNSAKNKLEATDAQAAASGQGIPLTVDLNNSNIHWLGSKVGGGHEGTISLKEGSLTINGDSVASGSFVIDMNTIVNTDLTDAKMNTMLVDHLKNADFFDVAQYPESKFTITKVEPVTNDSITHLISGNLKMKDVEKNITFGAKISKEDNVYKAVSVPFTIDRTQWNVKYGSKSIFKDLKDKVINDNIELQITIVANAAQS